MTLNDTMAFDHVIRVHEDGTVTDVSNVWAPSMLDEELDSADWQFFTYGYTGQHGTNGPTMHNCEYIGGRLETDILAQPGLYAAIVAYWSPDEALGDDDDTDTDEGWAIVYREA